MINNDRLLVQILLLVLGDAGKTHVGDLADHAEVAKIRDLAYREGMKPLRISGAMKVASGPTTLAEVFKVAPPSERP